MRLLLLTAGLLLGLASTALAGPRDLLPDLDQRPPFSLEIQRAGTEEAPRWRLGFGSAVDNLGAGTLIVRGTRPSRDVPLMRANQVIQRSDGSIRVVKGVGRLRYVVSPDHSHWHYVGFDRYELRRANDRSVVVRDRKSGFCLGDRYRASDDAGESFYTGRCGLKAPGLLRVQEGIAPGYGDNYKPHLEGQYLDLTGVPEGRYLLVHTANSDRALLESDYSNNAASLLVSVEWPDGPSAAPTVAPLDRCPDSATCG